MLHLELTYTVRYDRMEKYMLLESLETIPFIIVTVINLLSVNKAIYRLLNHKRIFDSSDDITFRFYVYPYVFLWFMLLGRANDLWKIVMAVSEISTLTLLSTVISVRQNVTEPFNEFNKSYCSRLIVIIVTAFAYGLMILFYAA